MIEAAQSADIDAIAGPPLRPPGEQAVADALAQAEIAAGAETAGGAATQSGGDAAAASDADASPLP